MMAFLTIVRKVLLTAVVIALISGCGSATNNDQGVSVSLLGFFTEFGECDSDLPAGLLGQSIPISGSQGFDSGTVGNNEILGTESGVAAILGLQNNITQQGFRAQRAYLEYYIEGASVQPPSTTIPFSLFVGPAIDPNADQNTGFDSSLPNSFGQSFCNRAFGQAVYLPAEVRAWLNLNRGSLPELPVTMVVSVTVTGLSTAGDRYDTNPVELLVNLTPDNTVPPTDGGGGGLA